MSSNNPLELLFGAESNVLAEDVGTAFANQLILRAMEQLPEDARQRCRAALASGDVAAATMILTDAAIDLPSISKAVAEDMARAYGQQLTDDASDSQH